MPVVTPGRYRAEIVSVAVRPGKESQSVSVLCSFFLMQRWDAATNLWLDVFSDGNTVEGNFCIIKRDGSRNPGQIKSFCGATGWDGDIRLLQAGSMFKPNKVQIDVEQDDYNGKIRMRASWIHRYESDPNQRGGPVQGLAGDELDGLAAKLGNLLEEPPKPPVPDFDPSVDDGVPF